MSSALKLCMGEEYYDTMLELNRLCVNEGLPRNALSFLVAQSLRMLPKPMVVVSYADSGQNHHGYIYQATNWLYTGLSDRHISYVVEGLEGMHPPHLMDDTSKVGRGGEKLASLIEKYGDRVTVSERSRKHRYFFFLGSKTQRRRMRQALQYPIEPYPKGDNTRYDASFQPEVQGILF